MVRNVRNSYTPSRRKHFSGLQQIVTGNDSMETYFWELLSTMEWMDAQVISAKRVETIAG
jgi:hypothetical protein